MSFKVGMPNLGHTMEEGRLVAWLVSIGEAVEAGQVIGEVETEKATFDIEAPADGMMLAIHVEEGADVPVGTVLAVIGEEGEALEEAHAPALDTAPVTEARDVVVQDAAAQPAKRILATPAARRKAEALGIDLTGVAGSGEDGMISVADVEDAAAARTDAVRALSQMRKAIADATSRAWAEIPHVPLTAHAALGTGVTGSNLTAAIVRATALALRAHPDLNGWLTAGGFQRADGVHVGVVVAVPDGLMTVTLDNADTKDVAEIAAEIADLAESARAGSLRGSKTTGASFTVSSLGRWGVDSFAPVISAPQVGILGVGRLRRTPREDGESFRFVDEIALTLVFDHRANDGVAAAKCLADIVRHLEQPEVLS